MLTRAARASWTGFAFALAACATAHPPGASVTGGMADKVRPADGKIEAAHVTVEAGLYPPMPTALTSFGAASDGQYLYVAGGYHGTPHQYSREGQVRDVQRLALTPPAAESGKGWERIGTLPEGTQGLALVEHNGRLCRFGGSIAENTADQPSRMRSSAAAACMDATSGSWQPLPDLPKGLSSHAAARVGSTVYVVGGWTLSGEPRGPFNEDVYALDLSAPDRGWQTIKAPDARRGAAAAAVGDNLVVVGGISPHGTQPREVAVYDTRARKWSAGPEYPEDAFGGALASVAEVGVVASASSGRLFTWKPGQEAWQPAGTLAFPRFFHQLVKAPEGSVVAVGGITGMHASGRVRQVERRALVGRSPQLSAWSMDYAGTAKNRQAAFVMGEHLYLFGGNNSLGQHDFSVENFVSEGVRVHLPSLQSERIAEFPIPAQSMVVARVGERVMSLGGFGPGPHGALTQAEIFELDPKQLSWQRIGALPRGRTQFGVATQGDRLWVLGGLNYDPTREENDAFDHVLDVLSGPANGLADTGVRLRGPRRAFAGATLHGQYYLVGGMRNDFALVDGCARFDLASQTFSDLPCPAQTRLSGTLLELAGKLYLVGGSAKDKDNLAPSPEIDVFDPASSSWSRLAYKLPFNTRHAHVLPYGDRILIVSTHNDEGRIRIGLLDVASAPTAGAHAAQPLAAAQANPGIGQH